MRSGYSAMCCLFLMATSAFAQSQSSLPQAAPQSRDSPRPDRRTGVTAPPSQQAAAPRKIVDPAIIRKNAWTVGLASGQLEGVFPRFAAEIKKVLDDGDEMRVMPIITYGAASNIEELLYTNGVDVAFTQADALAYLARTRPNLSKRIRFITALYMSEVHILARREIGTIQDLSGKTVSFGPMGHSASLTGPIVFDRLKIGVNAQYFDHTAGLEKLKSGEIDAVLRVIGKPASDAFEVPKDLGLHFLAIPVEDAAKRVFDDLYSLGKLTSRDYPELIPEGQVIDTISVSAVLAVYNWPKGSDRFRRLERFTKHFFERFDSFLGPGFHPKWKEINLAALTPGWTRFSVAERMVYPQLAPRGKMYLRPDANLISPDLGARTQADVGAPVLKVP
jgi:uncharacterized protein